MDTMDICQLFSDDDDKNPHDYADLTNRMKRTLYYDPVKEPGKDTLSYSATESAVAHFREVVPLPMGKLGHRYASRVAREACISPCAMLLGLIYIERLKKKNPKYLESVSSSELFLISMMVSSKYLYDEGCDEEVFNDEWAVSGDVDVAKVNKLEREFLHAIDWHLYVHPHEFSSMLNAAETKIALVNGRKRGWLTYCDLMSLLNSQKISDRMTQTAKILSKVSCFCAIVYGGLVCVTALTSVALIAMSTKSHVRFSDIPIHSNLPSSSRNLSENDSSNDRPVSDLTSPSFHDIRKLNRHRVLGSTAESLTEPTRKLESKSFDETTFSKSDAKLEDDEIGTTCSIEDRESSVSRFLEAIFVMTNVPRLCIQDSATPVDTCPRCGKTNVEQHSRHYINYFTDLMISRNCTMHSDLILGKGSPTLLEQNYRLNAKRLCGIYNPTVPPLMTMPLNRNPFSNAVETQ